MSEADDGQGDALRKGFALANGDILAWINSDDVYCPDAVERAVDALQRSGADVLYGNLPLIDAEGSTIGEWRRWPFLPFFSRRGLLYGGFQILQPASFWTRDVYERAGGIDPSYLHCMDADLMTKVRRMRSQVPVREAGIRRIQKAPSLQDIDACGMRCGRK